MLINSFIIILREVFEAALIVSVLLALCQILQLPRRYFLLSFMLGSILAIVYAINISSISMLFEGVGQEIINASLHFISFICLQILIFSIASSSSSKMILWAIVGSFSAAFVREGFEIIIYILGFVGIEHLFDSVVAGSFIGAGVGFSIGVFFYYLIVSFNPLNGLRLGLFVLILVSGAMMIQALQLLIQADIIISQVPLWNSSGWVRESSVTGQILYALLGYESTPSPIQVVAYSASLLFSSTLAIKSLNAYKMRIKE